MPDTEKFRCGFVAVIGRPNVGKSTMINAIVGRKVSIVTPKPQTTRHRIVAVHTQENSQILFVDTPGLHRNATKAMNRMMNRTAASALSDADLILFLCEANRWTEEDEAALKKVIDSGVPTIAVLNKQLKTNYNYVGSFPMGAGWSHAKNSMKSWIFEYIIPLTQDNKNVIFIAHEKAETVKREGREDETKYGISLPGQTGTLITSLCDAIGRVHIKNAKHMISFSPAHDLGGSRIKALAGKDIPLNIKIMRSVIEKYTPKPVKGIKEVVDNI